MNLRLRSFEYKSSHIVCSSQSHLILKRGKISVVSIRIPAGIAGRLLLGRRSKVKVIRSVEIVGVCVEVIRERG